MRTTQAPDAAPRSRPPPTGRHAVLALLLGAVRHILEPRAARRREAVAVERGGAEHVRGAPEGRCVIEACTLVWFYTDVREGVRRSGGALHGTSGLCRRGEGVEDGRSRRGCRRRRRRGRDAGRLGRRQGRLRAADRPARAKFAMPRKAASPDAEIVPATRRCCAVRLLQKAARRQTPRRRSHERALVERLCARRALERLPPRRRPESGSPARNDGQSGRPAMSNWCALLAHGNPADGPPARRADADARRRRRGRDSPPAERRLPQPDRPRRLRRPRPTARPQLRASFRHARQAAPNL